ncbi:MAG: alkaline phosphatase family protein [Ruminococcaceae bacterium]|nr:alkaline phosphatase family protein [Oscillospiraceae bacterium]
MIKYPDYDRSILSIASSVLKHFGVTDCPHKTLPEFDKLLAKDYKNVIVMLFDGLGTSTLNYHLEETDFLRQHYVTDISSVFPSTTVAATTSILSGYSPLECAWLGWDLYFHEIGENVAVFKNTLQRNGESAAKYNVAHKYIPYKSIMKRIEEVKGRKSAYCVAFFSKYRIKSVEDICKTIYKLSKKRKKKYIYAYWHQPDGAMHGHGVTSKEAHEQILHINKEVEKLCGKLKDSLVIITADHGQCDGVTKYLEDYPKLVELLKIPPSIEPRALSFFVKDGKTEEFKTEFKNAFGESFRLMSKDEVFKENILGFGEEHPKTKDFIGDFFAVALDETAIDYKRGDFEFVGVHAGLTEAEMTVPFIAIETEKRKK